MCEFCNSVCIFEIHISVGFSSIAFILSREPCAYCISIIVPIQQYRKVKNLHLQIADMQ